MCFFGNIIHHFTKVSSHYLVACEGQFGPLGPLGPQDPCKDVHNCPKSFNPKCGEDTYEMYLYQNECFFHKVRCLKRPNLKMVDRNECRGVINQDPFESKLYFFLCLLPFQCFFFNISEELLGYDLSQMLFGNCPVCADATEKPICALDPAGHEISFHNECLMNRYNCKKNIQYRKVLNTRCRVNKEWMEV